MSKLPMIERSYCGTGLTGNCAYLWVLFLMNEADMENDIAAYDEWKSMAETLEPKRGRPTPASVHYVALEKAIERYTK